MTTSESKGRFFTKRIDSHNESNRIDSNRELECSSCYSTPAADGRTHGRTRRGLGARVADERTRQLAMPVNERKFDMFCRVSLVARPPGPPGLTDGQQVVAGWL